MGLARSSIVINTIEYRTTEPICQIVIARNCDSYNRLPCRARRPCCIMLTPVLAPIPPHRYTDPYIDPYTNIYGTDTRVTWFDPAVTNFVTQVHRSLHQLMHQFIVRPRVTWFDSAASKPRCRNIQSCHNSITHSAIYYWTCHSIDHRHLAGYSVAILQPPYNMGAIAVFSTPIITKKHYTCLLLPSLTSGLVPVSQPSADPSVSNNGLGLL